MRRPSHRRFASILAVGTSLALTPSGVASADVIQPPIPAFGPGSIHASHDGVRVSSGGSGPDAWFAFEPTRPRPKRAPLAIVTHGYYEFSGHSQLDAFIDHTVRTGHVVIYPRYQTAIATPCPGPYDIEPCMRSEVNGIRGALKHLRSGSRRVHPDLDRTSYFGFSFGGIITANLVNRWRELGMPKPRAVFLDDPHDGGLNGDGEPSLDERLSGIPRSTLFECHSGADGIISQPGKADSSCNAVFPKLSRIPKRDKDLVLTHTDVHGTPALSSAHGVCAGGSGFGGPPDAYDWNFCWRVWDGLQRCAYAGRWCGYALGDSAKHTDLGRWSDGVPVKPLEVRNRAPIRP